MSTRSPKPRRSSKSPGAHKRRMTELDKDRNSRGKEIAAERGLVWTKDVPTESKNYEPILRDDSHMAKQEVGFLDIGKAEPTHAYDVGGEWKLLYKKPGEDGSDKPAGPGITPRVSPDTTPKTSPKIAPKKVPKASPKPKKKPPKPMTIFVRNYDGLTFTLDNVKPHDKIDDIHNRIEDEHHIPREHQRLRLGRQPLKNPDRTLKECHIEDQTTLDLDPMEIHVVEPYGNKKHTLIVEPTETIDEVKDKVEDKTGIPKKDQILTFGGRPLDNNRKTLEDYGIQHNDTLNLEPMEIKVRAPDGRIAELQVRPDDTIPDIKDQVKEKLGIPPKDQRPTFKNRALPDNSTLKDNNIRHGDTIDLQPMEIKVRNHDGRTTKLTVDPDDTIPDIKDQVEEKLGIPPEDQRPTFKNKPLPDNSTLRDNKIKHGDVIDLQPMKIKVRAPDGRVADLIVDPDDTIPDIKDQVETKLGIPPEDQRPTFNNIPLPDNSTLRDNGIKHGDVVDLEPMKIKVRAPDGRIADLTVDPNDTIDDVKKQVKKQLGIPTKDQRPAFNDKPLPDNSTLNQNNIRHGDVIDLQPMEIYVIDLDGKKGTYEVDPSDSIGDLKSRVEDKTGVDRDNQRLTFKGVLLEENDNTLSDVGIKHKDTLKLEPWKVHVRLPGGKKITFDVNPKTTTPNDLKNKIKQQEGIIPKKQILKLKGKELDDPTNLEDNGVKHNDVIDLRMTPPPVQLKAPDVDKRDFKRPVNPDRYGNVTVTTFKTRYDGEPGESFIDGVINKETTEFKWSSELKSGQ